MIYFKNSEKPMCKNKPHGVSPLILHRFVLDILNLANSFTKINFKKKNTKCAIPLVSVKEKLQFENVVCDKLPNASNCPSLGSFTSSTHIIKMREKEIVSQPEVTYYDDLNQ